MAAVLFLRVSSFPPNFPLTCGFHEGITKTTTYGQGGEWETWPLIGGCVWTVKAGGTLLPSEKVLPSEYLLLSRRKSLFHCHHRGVYAGVKLLSSASPAPKVTIHSPTANKSGVEVCVPVCVCRWGAYLPHTPATVAVRISIATPFLMVSGQYKLTSNHRCAESRLCPHPQLCQRERKRRTAPLVIQNHSRPAQQREESK